MFNIPLNLVLINPIFDTFLIVFVIYFFIFKYYYLKIYLKKPESISGMDLKITIILFIYSYINFVGLKINFFNYDFDGLSLMIFAQILIEAVFVFGYWSDVKKGGKKLKKFEHQKTKEIFKREIADLKMIEKIMENDLDDLKRSGQKKATKQLETELGKVQRSIKDLKNKLKDLEKDDKKK